MSERLTLDLDTELKLAKGKIDSTQFRPSERLELLAQAVERSQHFNQSNWGGDNRWEVLSSGTECGTPACVAGHAEAIFQGMQTSTISMIPNKLIGDALGLSMDEMGQMFGGDAGMDEADKADPNCDWSARRTDSFIQAHQVTQLRHLSSEYAARGQ